MNMSLCFSMLASNGGRLHHLHWLLFLLALYFLFLSGILLSEIRRRNYNESQTMRSAREWRKQLLDSVYNSAQNRTNAAMPSPKKETFAATKTMPLAGIWSMAFAGLRTLSRTIAARWTKRGPSSTTKGWARIYTLVFCTVVFGLAFAVNRPPKYPVEIRRNVYVFNESRHIQNSWGIWTADHGWERFDCCPDFPCSRVVWVGWIADEVVYEERGNCKSIRAQGLGFFWRKNGPARRIE